MPGRLQRSAQFKRGVVTLIDGANPSRVRVKFDDEDGVQSFWLSVMTAGSMGTRHARTPRIGEQVACLVDWRGEDGVIMGGLYSSADPRPAAARENDHVAFEDGSVAEHDPVSRTHRVQMPGGALFFAVGDTRLKITKDGVVTSKPIVTGDVPDIPLRSG